MLYTYFTFTDRVGMGWGGGGGWGGAVGEMGNKAISAFNSVKVEVEAELGNFLNCFKIRTVLGVTSDSSVSCQFCLSIFS